MGMTQHSPSSCNSPPPSRATRPLLCIARCGGVPRSRTSSPLRIPPGAAASPLPRRSAHAVVRCGAPAGRHHVDGLDSVLLPASLHMTASSDTSSPSAGLSSPSPRAAEARASTPTATTTLRYRYVDGLHHYTLFYLFV
jgi:hypothetical protein